MTVYVLQADTAEVLGVATAEEIAASDAEVARGHAEGIFLRDGVACYTAELYYTPFIGRQTSIEGDSDEN